MSRYVDIDTLGIGPANPDVFRDRAYADGWNAAIKILDNCLKDIPAADVAPVRHGRWIFDAENYEWNCSECHDWPIDGSADDERTYYCPNCGAKMDAEG